MRLITLLTLFTFSSSIVNAQLVKIDMEIKNRVFKKDLRQVRFAKSDDSKTICGLFPIDKEDNYYELHIFNQEFESLKKIESFYIGAAGKILDLYVHDNNIINVTSHYRPGILKTENKITIYKAALETSKVKDLTLSLNKKQHLIGFNHVNNNYYIITAEEGIGVKTYWINTERMDYKEQLISGTSNFILFSEYESILPNDVDNFLIKEDDYFYVGQSLYKRKGYIALKPELRMQTYFKNREFIIIKENVSKSLVKVIDLNTGTLKNKTIPKLYPHRTARLMGNKYYVLEVDGNIAAFKVFDFDTGELINKYTIEKKGNSTFLSTKAKHNDSEVAKNKTIIKKLSKGDLFLSVEQIDSLGIIGVNFDYFHYHYLIVTSGEYGGSSTYFEDGVLSTHQMKNVNFETWVKPDGSLIPFEPKASPKSTRRKISTLLGRYYSNPNYSKFSIFKFKNHWYFGCYDKAKKQYLVYEI